MEFNVSFQHKYGYIREEITVQDWQELTDARAIEVEPTGKRGRMTTRSGQNDLKVEKYVVNTSKTKRPRYIRGYATEREHEVAGCRPFAMICGMIISQRVERTYGTS